MTSKRLLTIIGLGVLLIMGNTLVAADVGANVTTDIDTKFTYDYTKTINTVKEYNITAPEVGSYIENNITDLTVPDSVTYSNLDSIPGLDFEEYRLVIDITNILVINDHDSSLLGAGEIFVEGYVNGNYTRYPAVGDEYSLNDGEDVDTSINLLDDNVVRNVLIIEVRESDFDTDDSLGFIKFNTTQLVNVTQTLTTDLGDAIVTFDIKAYEKGTKTITAGELLDQFKPYLSVDDETDETEMPDLVSGRVINGSDGSRHAYVLQYFFYWDAEYSPDGGVYSFMLHENDFEGLLIYLDSEDIYNPYRLVFNGYQYTDLPGFPNENILIFENDATLGSQEFTNDISTQLNELLGAETTQTAEYHDMDELLDWQYGILSSKDVRKSSPMGFGTVEMTVDTSYHTFDLGPGGADYGQVYPIVELDEDLLKSWYAEIDGTFANGTHSWSYVGIDIPITGPFTFDVTQVFAAPYIISSYNKIVTDAGAIARAKNSGLKITSQLEIGVTLGFPGNLEIEHPSYVTPGSTVTASLTLSNTNEIEVTFHYNLSSNIEFSYWFIQMNSTYQNSGEIVVDFDASTIVSVVEAVGLAEYETGDISLGVGFLTLDSLVISPKFVGTLLSADISLDLWFILENVITSTLPHAIPILRVLSYFIDEFTLTASMALESHVTSSISSGYATVTPSDLDFTEDAMTIDVEVSFSNDLSGVDNVAITISELSYVLDFTTDWSLNIGFKSPISSLISGFHWSMGTYPSLSAELLKSAGGNFNVEIKSTDIPTTPTTTAPIQLLPMCAMAVVLIFNKKRK